MEELVVWRLVQLSIPRLEGFGKWRYHYAAQLETPDWSKSSAQIGAILPPKDAGLKQRFSVDIACLDICLS